MPPTKTPTFSLSVVELLAKRVWYRGLFGIRKMCSRGVFPKTRATHRYTRLPQEIVDLIIAYLFYDVRTLRACSLTCYSLYIAAVPHLHHTLTVDINSYLCSLQARPPTYHSSQWTNHIQHMNKLDLLPFVKKLRICGTQIGHRHGFYPELASYSLLHKFSALSNVRELLIEYLDISNFTQRPQRLFCHFLPTVQSLALIKPKGSHRQIIYFIGLFQHLEDLNLQPKFPKLKQEYSVDDLTLIPHFAPPLRGRLTMLFSNKVELVGDMISLFGGLRFRSMDLYCVDGMRLLLGACAETLETLRLHLEDLNLYPPEFDLSRNKSLRTLEAQTYFTHPMGSRCLPYTLLTAKYPLSYNTIIIYKDGFKHLWSDVTKY